ncbi:MAG: AIR synthase-related protein [Spirosomataceae bacterium]
MTQKSVRALIQNQLIASAHDLSDGGLFITLAESAMAANKGFEINTNSNFRLDAYLFGEAAGRILVTVKPSQLEQVNNTLQVDGLSFETIGKVTSDGFTINGKTYFTISEAKDLYDNALSRILSK